jgi:hypothetical protein
VVREVLSCNGAWMASDPEHTDELKTVNEQLVAEGEALPAVRLKDGSRIQTGTVAMMLENVRRYDAGERGEIERQLEMAVPTLFRVGLFDLFSPEEWCAGNSPGRRFVGELALHHRTRG